MSDYDDDFEDGNDDFNDRDATKTIAKPTINSKTKPIGKKKDSGGVGYKGTAGKYATQNSNMDTLARDNTIGIKPKIHKKPFDKPIPSETPAIKKTKPNILGGQSKGLTKQGGIYSSTPNLKSSRGTQKRSLLGGEKLAVSRQVIKQFGLTKKAEQTIIPSKGMILEKADRLIEDAKEKIDKFKNDKDRVESGNIDEKLEVSIKENRYLQKTLIDMQDIINKVFEKYDPVKAPMKSYPQTERIKSPPKSVQMKYRTKEVENAQHALDNMMVEYEKVQARMEMIKDPNFFSNLHTQLDDINREMKGLELENKALQTEQKKREIEMEKLVAQGAPDTMFQINDLQNKVTITKDQLRKEEAENEEVDSLMQQVIEQEKALREKEAKLKEIGAKYDINFDTQVDERKQIEAEKLQAKRETYDKHLAIAESATKAMKKKLKTTSKQNKIKLKELENQKVEYEKELELKTEQVKEKNKEISELMERNQKLLKRHIKDTNDFIDKPSGGYDAVLKAIEEQNEKETQAVIAIQAWARMILAIRFVKSLKSKAGNNKKKSKVSKKDINEPKQDANKVDSGVGKEKAMKIKPKNKGATNYETDINAKPRKRDSAIDYQPESLKKNSSKMNIPETSNQIESNEQELGYVPSSKPNAKKGAKPSITPIKKESTGYINDKQDPAKNISSSANQSMDDPTKIANLKKATSKPSFAQNKSKLTSKPF